MACPSLGASASPPMILFGWLSRYCCASVTVSNARMAPLCASIMSATCCFLRVTAVLFSSLNVYPFGYCSEV